MNLLEKLDFMMEKLRINKSKLSELSGVPYTTIDSFYKKGYENTKLSTIKKLSEALGVSLDYLIVDAITDEDYGKTIGFEISISEKGNIIKYRSLDSFGKEVVDSVLDIEWRRCNDESQLRADMEEPEEPKVINLFSEPAAAGIAVPVLGTDYEYYELKPEDPPGAAYAVRLQGNSMEPHFPDGSIVFVNHDALRDGDIGVFSVDGGTVCKQYHQEGGVVYLFSLNRKRQDADVVFFPGGNRSLVCQGRVITSRRFPVPGHS